MLVPDGAPGPVGCARALGPDPESGAVSFGRVAVLPAWRGRGLGRILVAQSLAFLAGQWPDHDVRINAQRQLERFYGGFGFRPAGGAYDDTGIAHIDMRLVRGGGSSGG